MKQSLRLAPLAGTVALALATQASADRSMSDFERDMRVAFENDGEPMELALLSEKEMRETKGAVWPFKIAWLGRLFWGASYGWLKTGVDVYNRGNYGDIKTLYHLSSAQLMAYSLIGLVSAHPAIGYSLGLTADYSFRCKPNNTYRGREMETILLYTSLISGRVDFYFYCYVSCVFSGIFCVANESESAGGIF